MPYQPHTHALSSNDSWHILNPEVWHRRVASKRYRAFADLTQAYLSNTGTYLSFHHPSRSTPAQRRRVQVYKQPTGNYDGWETDSSGSQCDDEVPRNSQDENLISDSDENSIYDIAGSNDHSPRRTLMDTGLLDQEFRPMAAQHHALWSITDEDLDVEHSTSARRGLTRPFDWLTSHLQSNALVRHRVPRSIKRMMHRAFRDNVSR